MKEYIINIPQLQSLSKRLSSRVVAVVCWLMWSYLLFPIVTLLDWLHGDDKDIIGMHWFGGGKSLQQLLEIYLGTLSVLVVIWMVWIAIYRFCRSQQFIETAKTVIDQELCAFYHVDAEKVQRYREKQNVTVFFDENGKILNLE